MTPTANIINFLTSHKHSLSTRKFLGDYIAKLETYFNSLAIMGLPGPEETVAAILLVSVMSKEALKTIVAAQRPWMVIRLHGTAHALIFLKNVDISG